ncbi:hypothetical protein VNO78_08031 [Psophocarpus tetragonolobus]|uniref:Epidermal patterning factor-like protein n=1 Tax=Psophocarpus tetragonolobus TaxID=3891 RepID=A0AAN9T487_PSOTE
MTRGARFRVWDLPFMNQRWTKRARERNKRCYPSIGMQLRLRLVNRRRGVSLFGAPPFLAPLHFSHLSFYVPSLQYEKFSNSLSSSPLLTPSTFSDMRRDHRHIMCGQILSFIRISLCFLIISSWTLSRYVTEGRKTPEKNGFYQTVHDNKATMRAPIGSRPPRCERRCRSCGHCEAIQVPTNPQEQNGNINSSTVSTIDFSMGKDGSNYKPMSWKCKCGKRIFNP